MPERLSHSFLESIPCLDKFRGYLIMLGSLDDLLSDKLPCTYIAGSLDRVAALIGVNRGDDATCRVIDDQPTFAYT